MEKIINGVKIRNPRNAKLLDDGRYFVTIDIKHPEESRYDKAVYVAARDDPAPAGQWIIALIDAGRLGKVGVYKVTEEQLWADVRTQRDTLLIESDISVLPDRWEAMTEQEKVQWKTYRQSLRDLPGSTASPTKVKWPQPPQ